MKKEGQDPSLKRALKEVAKTARLQKRQLGFWLFLIIFASGLIWVARHANSLFADIGTIEENITQDVTNYTYTITVDHFGQVAVNDQIVRKVMLPRATIDEFRYKVFDKPKSFIDQVTIKVIFEKALPPSTKIASFAIHGIDNATEVRLDDHTIEYTATGIGPEASYTISAELPANTMDWPYWRRIEAMLEGLPAEAWLAFGLILPLVTLLMLLFMFSFRIKSFFLGDPRESRAVPPQALPPAIAGILTNGRVSSREIAATILDLANRGYITIYNKGKGKFAFAKRAPWQGLQSFELLLLSQMFQVRGYKSNKEDIESAIGTSLFSSQIAKVYVAMYDSSTQYGFFERNPAIVHRRYRLSGLLLFFLGLLAFIGTLVFNIQPTYLVFLFAGMMTMALVIIFASDTVPLHTKAGQAARLEWLAFRNYLADQTVLGYIEGAQSYYEKFLPYAVVLDVEIAWANRFRNYPFQRPDWYDSSDDAMAIEDFADGLYMIVGSIAELFSSAKEPTVQ